MGCQSQLKKMFDDIQYNIHTYTVCFVQFGDYEDISWKHTDSVLFIAKSVMRSVFVPALLKGQCHEKSFQTETVGV